jgi:hypothetical protein
MEQSDRRAIELVRGELQVGEARLYEHISRTFQWLMATLFTANGGASIALLGDGAHDLPGRIYALVWFALGLVSSLLIGGLSIVVALQASNRSAAMRTRLEGCLIMEETPPQKELLDFVDANRPNWKTWFPSYAGAASFTFFVIGIGTIAGSLLRAG